MSGTEGRMSTKHPQTLLTLQPSTNKPTTTAQHCHEEPVNAGSSAIKWMPQSNSSISIGVIFFEREACVVIRLTSSILKLVLLVESVVAVNRKRTVCPL